MQTSDREDASVQENAPTADAATGDGSGAAGMPPRGDGAFSDVRELVSVLQAAAGDVAKLLGLEAQLLVRAALMVAVLGIVLGLVLAAAWIMFALAIALALQQYVGLGMVSATLIVALLHLLLAFSMVLALKRLARRLTFPETRLALQTLWGDAGNGAGAR